MEMTPHDLIKLLDLKPHPEGGYYRESYRAQEKIEASALPKGFNGPRNFATAIYYMLTGDERSKLHRLASDETWHFYTGDPLCVVEIDQQGTVRETILGPDLKAGQKFQHVVPAGTWFGAYLPKGGFTLVGCTVSPGFDFADFEIAQRDELLRKFPKAGGMIEKLT